MTDPLSYETDPQALEEQAISAAAFATGIEVDTIRAVYEVMATGVQRATYLRIAEHVRRLAGNDDGKTPAFEVLQDLSEELVEFAGDGS